VSERAGRLSRTDKISRFLTYAEPAPTIDELIKHIPGLSNYTASPAYGGGNTVPTTLENLLSLIPPWDGVQRNQYSNSHYALLGAALHQANGLRYEEVVQRDIFGRVGMSRSSFVIPPESESVGFPFASRTDPSWAYAAGAVTSSAADLNRFNQALLSDLFGFGTVESFDRSAGVTSFGMWPSVATGELRFTHTGQIDSYSSYSVIFPGDRSSVVVLCNFVSNGLANFVVAPGGIRSLMLGS
jgi:CubicO group peptidase (beta-lactamase class C family)